MPATTNDEFAQQIQDRMRELPPAAWVQAMIEHYRRTGAYRPGDLRRLLGDPNRSVESGPQASIAAHFSRT